MSLWFLNLLSCHWRALFRECHWSLYCIVDCQNVSPIRYKKVTKRAGMAWECRKLLSFTQPFTQPFNFTHLYAIMHLCRNCPREKTFSPYLAGRTQKSFRKRFILLLLEVDYILSHMGLAYHKKISYRSFLLYSENSWWPSQKLWRAIYINVSLCSERLCSGRESLL